MHPCATCKSIHQDGFALKMRSCLSFADFARHECSKYRMQLQNSFTPYLSIGLGPRRLAGLSLGLVLQILLALVAICCTDCMQTCTVT